MEAYTGFAQVYDLFMDNVPYKAWSEYLISLLEEYGAPQGLVLDLGCGTLIFGMFHLDVISARWN